MSRIGAKGFLLVLANGSVREVGNDCTQKVSAHRSLAWLPGRDIKQEFPWRLRPITVSSFNLEKVELPERNGAYQGFIKMALGALEQPGRHLDRAGATSPTCRAVIFDYFGFL